jgi:hypothetical protein
MVPIDYLALRIGRRLIPNSLMHWILSHRLGVQPGLETREPQRAARRYEKALQVMGRTLQEAKVLILGYGGYYGLAVELLRLGAARVDLLDPYAHPHRAANRALAATAAPYLLLEGDKVRLNPDWMRILRSAEGRGQSGDPERYDVVLSWSVYEHVQDPARLTEQLARRTAIHGCHVHYIDLRDHYFRRPFEMLCHSEHLWRKLLNPPSNLNRLRAWQYPPLFHPHFERVEMDILERDPEALQRTRSRIRLRFLSGHAGLDSATRILIKAWNPNPN